MTNLKCDICGYTGEESDWYSIRDGIHHECPEYHADRMAAYIVRWEEEEDSQHTDESRSDTQESDDQDTDTASETIESDANDMDSNHNTAVDPDTEVEMDTDMETLTDDN